jgi:hypothetical protein
VSWANLHSGYIGMYMLSPCITMHITCNCTQMDVHKTFAMRAAHAVCCVGMRNHTLVP